jgi:hypothetical protein
MTRMQARFFVFARVAKSTEQHAHSVSREVPVEITFPLFDAPAAGDRIVLRGKADRRDSPQPRLEVRAHKHSPSFSPRRGSRTRLVVVAAKGLLREAV